VLIAGKALELSVPTHAGDRHGGRSNAPGMVKSTKIGLSSAAKLLLKFLAEIPLFRLRSMFNDYPKAKYPLIKNLVSSYYSNRSTAQAMPWGG